MTAAFREIRGVQQRRKTELRRWFQSAFFDVFTTQDAAGDMQWFQLCYARDTWRERVLEWRRGRGFQHLKPDQRSTSYLSDASVLVFDGILPYAEVTEKLEASAGLPADVRRFVLEKVSEYARPARRFRRPGAATPSWLERLRSRQRSEAAAGFLDMAVRDR